MRNLVNFTIMEPLVHDEDYFEKQLKLVLLGETSTGKVLFALYCQLLAAFSQLTTNMKKLSYNA